MKVSQQMRIPKAYRRNAKTKLLWLYKIGHVSRLNYIKCMSVL